MSTNITLIQDPTLRGIERFSLRGLTREDVLLISLALKPSREDLGRRLDDLRDPTIRTLTTIYPLGELPNVDRLCQRLADIDQVLNGGKPEFSDHVSAS